MVLVVQKDPSPSVAGPQEIAELSTFEQGVRFLPVTIPTMDSGPGGQSGSDPVSVLLLSHRCG